MMNKIESLILKFFILSFRRSAGVQNKKIQVRIEK
jgi:hypothetical protein